MAKSKVYLVFDRRKEADKKSVGKIEVVVKLTSYLRKYLPIGECTPEEFPSISRKNSVSDAIAKAQQVLDTLRELNEDFTIENYNHHAGIESSLRLSPEEQKA